MTTFDETLVLFGPKGFVGASYFAEAGTEPDVERPVDAICRSALLSRAHTGGIVPAPSARLSRVRTGAVSQARSARIRRSLP